MRYTRKDKGGKEILMAVELEVVPTYHIPDWECPQCGGKGFTIKPAEFPVTVSTNTLLVSVETAECDQCGYQLVDGDNAAKLDAAYYQLESGDFSRLTEIGKVYKQ